MRRENIAGRRLAAYPTCPLGCSASPERKGTSGADQPVATTAAAWDGLFVPWARCLLLGVEELDSLGNGPL
ncbi:hypothetical protein E2562_005104 [Oryza meyeriana var. granulata]|uniref:Uncharacterized protein n=1 Tax=Oryza meyeriana var. granulata TaxID=110450 RepID=A0A6G1BRL6_9ORYZ|nr:hypothetical protein E2562_005104 [Oryza meyeriana var. granulata]